MVVERTDAMDNNPGGDGADLQALHWEFQEKCNDRMEAAIESLSERVRKVENSSKAAAQWGFLGAIVGSAIAVGLVQLVVNLLSK